ncbi:nucleotidyltransferase domain-containing protein [Robertmurraya kyonggiensis]|uniref:Nucleotidyltransferase family protein n=1 Tax=Robertmurraya kyonggiensis TaxID=1037680 RepID=A0A4U1DBW0_9BACI|nr:nucleotidyltransferase family protein [Robertmurraya kyonggiensis]TKC19117.1 hypothetical protein FA727_06105 [Robertmurraya kyonggiensis]
MKNIESEILIMCSKSHLSEDEKKYVQNNIRYIKWNKFLYYCVHHRVVSIVYRNLEKIDLLDLINKRIRETMHKIFNQNAERNRIFYKELQNLNDEFAKIGIKVLLIKGGLLGPLLYNDYSLRELGDIDLLIKVEDIPIVTKILNNYGFIQGDYDEINQKITPVSRRKLLTQRMYSHELIEFKKISGNSKIPIIPVDVNLDVFWNTLKKGYSINTRILFENTQQFQINNTPCHHLEPHYHIIQLCAHFYNEAVFFPFKNSWVKTKQEVILMRICDIYELIKSVDINWNKLEKLITKYKIEEPVVYTLYIVNQVYNNTVPEDFFYKINISKSIIDIYYDKQGVQQNWDLSLRERLFSIDAKYKEIELKFDLAGFGH